MLKMPLKTNDFTNWSFGRKRDYLEFSSFLCQKRDGGTHGLAGAAPKIN